MHRTDGLARHRTTAHSKAGARARARHASARGEGFGRFTGLTMLALVPGAGLIATGRRTSGGLLLGLTISTIAGAGVLALSGNALQQVLTLAVQPRTLGVGAALVALAGTVWCLSIVATAWTARPIRPHAGQRLLGLALVAALVVAVLAPSSVGVRYALIQRDLVKSLFVPDTATKTKPVDGAAVPVGGDNPWEGVPRVNMLLLGSDAGANRDGVRTDSMIVASIDKVTGDTVLFGLPRSLQKVPFPATNPLSSVWPNGFDCGSECLLNAVWEQAATARPDLFVGDPNPGLRTTRDVIGEVLGLRIDTYATIDLDGFKSLVDAMGGVDVNVPRDIPIGGGKSLSGRQLPIFGTIPAGQQHLNGYQALWFARSRQGSDDYDRMGRQRCMVTSLLDQANPAQLLGRYPRLASVAKTNIETDIRQQDLAAWVQLVQQIQRGKISSLPFTNKVISTVNPDFDAIRALVAKAITLGPATTPSPSPSPSGTVAPKPATDVTAAQDASAVC